MLCCRHQWYQLQSKVTVEVYVKNLRKEQVRRAKMSSCFKIQIKIRMLLLFCREQV